MAGLHHFNVENKRLNPINFKVIHDQSSIDEYWSTPKSYCPSKLNHSKSLGQLDPSLYKEDEVYEYESAKHHAGRLWFSVNYKIETEQLTVFINKARNLRGKETVEYFVKIFLDTDERRVHTTSKQKSNNPIFLEYFYFQIPLLDLAKQCIKMLVFYTDRNRRQKLIGLTCYKLKDLTIFNNDLDTFNDLQVHSQSYDDTVTELNIALTLHQGKETRITIGLFDIQNLPECTEGQSYKIYAKVSLMMGLQCVKIKTKKTALEDSSCKSFNRSFTFKIKELNYVLFRIKLMQHNSLMGTIFDHSIGSVVLGSELFTKREELEHWRKMCANPDVRINFSHRLIIPSCN